MTNPYHEKSIHGTPIFPLQVYSQHDRDGFYFVPQHWHEEWEWIYVEYGVLNLTIHGRTVTLHPGEFGFVNAGELHELKSVGESLHHAIVFNPEFLNFALYDACQHNFIRPVTNGRLLFPASCSVLLPECAEKILYHMQEIMTLYHTLPACALLSIKLHILHIIELLFQGNYLLEHTASSKEEDSINKLKKVIEYIHENYASPVALETLSQICYMSPNYFCHYFKQEIGKTPIAFVNEYRIQKACELLTESELPVSQIALAAGFDNISYFIRKFQEHKGVTPKKYRKLCFTKIQPED
ncbi:MAG: AraC family transcriptional regulator [Lachnospiraceae bacterium]|nr:AraC family transcriptional regulator [Lachnospiraceae bacterium]